VPLIDLHAHTRCSDGTSMPAEVIRAYAAAGVQMMAVTDHDTTLAVQESAQRAAAAGILFIPGVEISTREHDYLHILGYGIDIKSQRLNAFLNQNAGSRDIRVKKIIKKLQAIGLDIGEEDVFKLVKTVPSRAHVADALKKKGLVQSRQEGFRKYLCEGAVGYVPSMGPGVTQVIAEIKAAGGKAFVAHPGVIKDAWDFPRWVNDGLDGIEVYYPSHSQTMRQDLLALAKKYKLLISAGTDYHGEKSGRCDKPGMQVPQEVFDSLKRIFNL